MSDINQVVICGRLTRDSELKFTTGGTAVARASVAVNRYAGQNKENEVSFFDVTIWGKQAEGLNQYLTKGKQVVISGELRQERWEKEGQKNSRVEIVARSIQLVGSKDEKSEPKKEEPKKQNKYQGPGPEDFQDDADEIPF
jgi:single-strand DNA-binding protein